jgi:hypothetical protein
MGARSSYKSGSFDPSTIVDAWLQNDTFSGDISSISDVLNTNPGLCTVGRRPVGEAGGAMTFDADAILIPPIAANNDLVKLAFAFWIELDDLTVQHYLLRYGPGGSNDPAATDSLLFRVGSDESLNIRIYNDATGTSAWAASTAINIMSGSPKFVTGEVDLVAAEADKVVITVNTVELSLSTAAAVGAPTSFPSSMQGAPSDIVFGNRRSNLSTLPFKGRIGRDIWWKSSSKSASAVRGLWSAEDRTNLMNYRPLV